MDRAADKESSFSARVKRELIPTIEKATVAFVAIQDDKIVHDRTGVLYGIAEHYFILTASHAGDGGSDLRAYNKHSIPWYLSVNAPGVDPIPLAGVTVHGTELEYRDIAAIHLPLDVVAKIRPHKEFIRQTQVASEDNMRSGYYVLFGYPLAWSFWHEPKECWWCEPLIYLTTPYDSGTHTDESCQPNISFALGFSQEATDATDGTPASLPSPGGISGCGVWRIPNPGASSSLDGPMLVGIQHLWNKDRGYVKGTRINFVIERILSDFPDLAPAMELLFRRRG